MQFRKRMNEMKLLKLKKQILPLLLLVVAFSLTGCNNAKKIEKAFVISESEFTVMAGQSKQLTLNNPENTNVGEYTLAWMTENSSVATVKDDGTVTGVAPGTTKITVAVRTAKEDVYFSSNVTVTENTTPLSSIAFRSTVYALSAGQAIDLNKEIVYSPENAVKTTLTWTSSNPDIASVSGGIISPVSQGISTVTVTTEDGNISASCTVRVSEIDVPATGISFENESYNITVGETLQLIPNVAPKNATGYSIVWTSSDPQIAITTGGYVKGETEGEVTITATLNTKESSLSATCTVIVGPAEEVFVPATELQLTPTGITIGESDEGPFKFSYTIVPANCTETPVWSTSRPDLLSINETTGEFTLIKAPKDILVSVLVTCTVGDLSKDAVVNISPRKPVLEIAINEDSTLYDVAPHNTIELVARYIDSEELPEVIWSSSDPSIATVETDGKVTGRKAGTCTITATSKIDPSVSATYTVNVQKAPYLSLKVGQTVSIDPDLIPSDPVNWNSFATLVELNQEAKTIKGLKECIEKPTMISCYSQSTGDFYPIEVYVFPAE